MIDIALDEKALVALASAYDKEDAAQRGEPDPWAFDAGADGPWREERLACAQAAIRAYRRSSLSQVAPSNPAQVTDAARELWDDATNAVCQTMQERGMCNCSDGDCVAAKVEPAKEDIAHFTAAIGAGGQAVAEDWRDDPSADERWNAGLDYGQTQLCAVLGIDPATVDWDAATETLDGDVQAVIGKILTARFGDDWPSALSQPHSADERVAEAASAVLKWLDGGCSSWGVPEQQIRILTLAKEGR